MEFAVVDIETTGGSSRNERIIEIAIVVTDGRRILETFETLVNPERHIPEYITAITGITNDMVFGAPVFADIANKVDELTKDRVFVAHSVNFDFSFIKNEFQLLDFQYERKKLCTVRLSRKIFPGFRSYSLGSLCSEVGIAITNRHRALGDAHATAILMNMLVESDRQAVIPEFLKHASKEAKLPPNVPRESYENLPDRAGVYYFLDEKGKIIYVGKAKNLKKRVASHFTHSGSLGEKSNFLNKICDIDYLETGNELIALLVESAEIKRHWPEYNRSQKKPSSTYGLYEYTDHSGYVRFTLSKMQKGWKPLMTFSSLAQGRDELYQMVRQYRLCAKLCGLQPAKETCYDHSVGVCDGACAGKVLPDEYNSRIAAALETENHEMETFVILGAGRKLGEKSVVVVERGIFQGYGFVSQEESLEHFEQFVEKINLQKETPEIRSIVRTFAVGKPGYEVLPIEKMRVNER